MSSLLDNLGNAEIGLNPDWANNDRFLNIEVLGPCTEVAQAYIDADDAENSSFRIGPQTVRLQIHELCGDSLPIPTGRDFDDGILVYQLKRSSWTHIHSFGMNLSSQSYAPKPISNALATKAVVYFFDDCSYAYGYTIFDRGVSIEEYVNGEFPPDHFDELIAKGWIVNREKGIIFRSSRVANIDTNSAEFERLPIEFAREWGLAVPYQVWDIDHKSGKFVIRPPWTAADFQEAKVLWHARIGTTL